MTRLPDYTPQELDDLKWYNERIQFFHYAGIFGFLTLLATLNGLDRFLSARLSRSLPSDKEVEVPTAKRHYRSAVVAILRKWNNRRSILVEATGLRNGAQLGVLMSYLAITFALCFSHALGHWDYIAHHFARISFAHIPLLVGLASRELGFISWATGLHSSTLIAFHRWLGRFVVVFALLHVTGRVVTNSPTVDFKSAYQVWGLIGLILWCSMAILSINAIRTRFYRFFIFSHISAFALSLVCLSLHRPQVAPYIIAGAVLYISDRLVRFASIVYYSTLSRKTKTRSSVTIEMLSQNIIKVHLETTSRWKAGEHAYLHLPLIEAGGHPFSISSTFLPVSHLDGDPLPTIATQTFIIRVHQGFTRKIYDAALEMRECVSTDGEEEVKLSPALSEGPYGHNLRLHRYESVLLIVGGTGITFALPLVLDLVRRARNASLGRGGNSTLITQRVTLVWNVRTVSEIDWIGKELREAIYYAPPGFLDVQIYVTRGVVPIPSTDKIVSYPLATCDSSRSSPRLSTTTKDSLDLRILPASSSATLAVDSTSRRCSASTIETVSSTSRTLTCEDDSPVFDYLPTSPIDEEQPSTRLPPLNETTDATRSVPYTTNFSDVRIPTLSGRCRTRELLSSTISKTSPNGSIAVGTCGPSQLTEEVGRSCSDFNEPGKVWRGEERLNIMLHVESYGW